MELTQANCCHIYLYSHTHTETCWHTLYKTVIDLGFASVGDAFAFKAASTCLWRNFYIVFCSFFLSTQMSSVRKYGRYMYTIYINTYMYIYSFDAMRCDAMRCCVSAALFFHIVSLFCKSQILAEKLRKFSQAIFRLHFSEG